MAGIKGVFLSMDSMLALLLAIAAIAMLSVPQETSHPETGAFESVWEKMQDISAVSIYLRKTPSDFGLRETSAFTKQHWKCSTETHPIETSPFNNSPDLQKHYYCEEA